MTTQLPEEFQTNISVGQLLEDVIIRFEEGKHKSESDIQSLSKFVSRLEEDIKALDGRSAGLGRDTLHQIRQMTPAFTYTELGATLSYLRHVLNGSHDKSIIHDRLNQLRTVKSQYGLNGTEYRVFLEYVQLFKSEKPINERVEEFNEVFSTVKDAFKKGYSRLARITKEVDGSWDSFLQSNDKSADQYHVALQYKQFEEKYGIRIGKVEELLDKIPQTLKE